MVLLKDVCSDAGTPPSPQGPCRAPRPPVGASCHVPGPWLSSGSWGEVLLLLGRAPYLISQGPRLMDRRACSLSHPLPGRPILQPSGRGWVWRWIVGHVAHHFLSLCSSQYWLWVPRGLGARMRQFKPVVGEIGLRSRLQLFLRNLCAPGLLGLL